MTGEQWLLEGEGMRTADLLVRGVRGVSMIARNLGAFERLGYANGDIKRFYLPPVLRTIREINARELSNE